MKARRVIVTLEIETDFSLAKLQNRAWWQGELAASTARGVNVVQVQANVVRRPKGQ